MKGSLKVWAVILGMVVAGTGITHMTNSYVSHQIEKMEAAAEENTEKDVLWEEPFASGEMALEDAEENLLPGRIRSSVTEDRAEGEVEEAVEEAARGSQDKGAEEAALEEGVQAEGALELAEDLPEDKSDIGTKADASVLKERSTLILEIVEYPADLQESLGEYRERFPQIDVQIEQMRKSETENNVYSVKNTVQTEQRIWEREMEGLYRLLCDSLDEASCRELKKDQQEWLQLRDDRAETAAKKNSGGSLESVDYLASLAASNRERAYALLDKYQEQE